MPKKELKYLSIDTSNGNILADNLEVQKGTIDTSNGYITVEGENKSDEFEKNTDAENVLSIDTSNGNISVNWLSTCHVVDIMSMKKRGRLSQTSLV